MTPADAVRASYADFAGGDLDGALAPFTPEVEWQQAQGLPHGGVYRGIAAVRADVFDPLDRDWWSSPSRPSPDEFLDAGTRSSCSGATAGGAQATGNVLDVPFVHVWSFEDGKAGRFRQYRRHRRAGTRRSPTG